MQALNRRIVGLISSLILLISCNTTGYDPFQKAGVNLYDQQLGERIQAYHLKDGEGQIAGTSGPALYIDFSSGINNAFNDPTIKNLMADCFNTILSQEFEVYKLGNRQITPLNIANTTQLGQQIANPAEYQDIWAPIQDAVDSIVNGEKDALLITDFEEWQDHHEITTTAYLKKPFKKWLEKGNSIHFFIKEYQEGSRFKYLYFTIFSYGKADASGFLSKLAPKLMPFTTRFDLSVNPYTLATTYPSPQAGGVFYETVANSKEAKNILDLKGNYLNGQPHGHSFEFYPFGIDWETINKLRETYQLQNDFNDFFRRLFIDLSNEDSYLLDHFGVSVSDVTSDFEHFSRSEEAIKRKPKFTQDSNGNSQFDPNEKDPIVLEYYDPATGKLKESYRYRSEPTTPLNDVFTLNTVLFANTKKANHHQVELAVSFDPKFSLKHIPDPNALIKVDIILTNSIPNISGAKISKFQWINAQGKENIALSESIKNTLLELKPSRKVIYSYYIKTQQ